MHMIAWPAQSVNTEQVNDTHRGRSDVTFYSRCLDATSSIRRKVVFSEV